jgi:hypothetical protein
MFICPMMSFHRVFMYRLRRGLWLLRRHSLLSLSLSLSDETAAAYRRE